MIRIKDLSIRKVETEEDKQLPAYDFSKLNAMATCNAWGAIRYGQNKTMELSERMMALEAGSLAHDVFAILRLKSAYENHKETIDAIKLEKEVKRIIPDCEEVRAVDIVDYIINHDNNILIDFVCDSSGYYNDPSDKKRTLENIKESCYLYSIRFSDYVKDHPVYVDENIIGTEHEFDLVVAIDYTENGEDKLKQFRFIGKIDGIHFNNYTKEIELHENKTASRMGDVWLSQWQLSHQITGYCLAASAFTGKNCNTARVVGLQLPLPVKSPLSGVCFECVNRQDHMFEDWATWVISMINLYEEYTSKPQEAVQNTNSCCRYFRSCMFIPICTLPKDLRKDAIEEMPVSVWSPLSSEGEGSDD